MDTDLPLYYYKNTTQTSLIDDDYDMIDEIIKHRYDADGTPSFFVKLKQLTYKSWDGAPSFIQGC